MSSLDGNDALHFWGGISIIGVIWHLRWPHTSIWLIVTDSDIMLAKLSNVDFSALRHILLSSACSSLFTVCTQPPSAAADCPTITDT